MPTRAYSLDLRERIVRAVDQGYPRAEIVQLFGVSLATIKRYIKQRRGTGHLRRKPIPGHPPQKSAPLQTQIVEQLEAHADATLQMHCDLWEHTSGVRVSISTMSGVIRRVGWTRKKKTLGATERNEDARAAWREHCQNLDAKQLVVIDECGSNIGLTPLYARAPKGVRAYGRAPRNRGKNATVIAALTWCGMGEAMIIEGSATALTFEQYMEVILAPSLSAGQIVILDNLAAHKSPRVEELIRKRGCQLLFLPGYSPDFSPIEETFSKLKASLRRAEARTREALQEAIGQALQTVTTQDAQGWFRHCGYLPAAEELAGRD
jgi:transposase